MSVTIVDIAKQLNISHSTVSLCLNNKPGTFISETTRQKVIETAKEMGYVPNRSARALATGKTYRIAFWSPSIEAMFFQNVACRIHHILKSSYYDMIIGELDLLLHDPTSKLGLRKMDVDGVLMYGGNLGLLKDRLELKFPFKAPVVNMGLPYSGQLDFVEIDLYGGSCQAVDYMLAVKKGNRIAHLLGEATNNLQDARYRAYHERLSKSGLKSELIIVDELTRASARKCVQDHIRKNGCPKGIFCANDELAIGTYRGLCELGLKVPDDVVLVGCDGIEDIDYLGAPIFTIVQPIEEMCQIAWDFLLKRMKNNDMPRQYARLEAKFRI